ncbi:unnamed protein product [Rotaria sp. Silwood1]|nr:unnamed protein product [Rotaria sp. Silwood1]
MIMAIYIESQEVIYSTDHKTCIRSNEYFPSSNHTLTSDIIDDIAKIQDEKQLLLAYAGADRTKLINVDLNQQMKFCGCLTVRRDSQDEPTNKCIKRYFLKRDLPTNDNGSIMSAKVQKDRTKSNTSTITQSHIRQYTLKKQSSSRSINEAVLHDDHHNVSKRRSVTFANDSETEQRKFLRLNKTKRGSINELQFNDNKRAISSPNVNHLMRTTINTSYETTTCDELDNSQQKKTVVRRRKRSKSPRKQFPSEILDAIKFDLVESVGLDENQLKTIPYENIKTSSQPIRISLSSYSSQQQKRRRRSSPFNRSGGIVHSASTYMLYYHVQPTVVSTAQVKSTKVISVIQNTENCMYNHLFFLIN